LRRIVFESCGEKGLVLQQCGAFSTHSQFFRSLHFCSKQLRRWRRRGRRTRRGQILGRRGGKGILARPETGRAGSNEFGASTFDSNAVFIFVARVSVPSLMRRTRSITTVYTPQVAPRQETRGGRGRGRGNFEGRGRGRSDGARGGGRSGGRGRGRAPNFYFQPPPYGYPMQQAYAAPPQQPFYPGGHPGWSLSFVLLKRRA